PCSHSLTLVSLSSILSFSLSLLDALPIFRWYLIRCGSDFALQLPARERHPHLFACRDRGRVAEHVRSRVVPADGIPSPEDRERADRKSTRLNSSHQIISYAVFCLKKRRSV